MLIVWVCERIWVCRLVEVCGTFPIELLDGNGAVYFRIMSSTMASFVRGPNMSSPDAFVSCPSLESLGVCRAAGVWRQRNVFGSTFAILVILVSRLQRSKNEQVGLLGFPDSGYCWQSLYLHWDSQVPFLIFLSVKMILKVEARVKFPTTIGTPFHAESNLYFTVLPWPVFWIQHVTVARRCEVPPLSFGWRGLVGHGQTAIWRETPLIADENDTVAFSYEERIPKP